MKQVVLSLGVNDLITSYPIYVIQENIRQLMELLVSRVDKVL